MGRETIASYCFFMMAIGVWLSEKLKFAPFKQRDYHEQQSIVTFCMACQGKRLFAKVFAGHIQPISLGRHYNSMNNVHLRGTRSIGVVAV